MRSVSQADTRSNDMGPAKMNRSGTRRPPIASASTSSPQYWTGCIDALTNVVVAIVFVLVVITISLNFAVQLIVEKAEQPAEGTGPRAAAVAAAAADALAQKTQA